VGKWEGENSYLVQKILELSVKQLFMSLLGLHSCESASFQRSEIDLRPSTFDLGGHKDIVVIGFNQL